MKRTIAIRTIIIGLLAFLPLAALAQQANDQPVPAVMKGPARSSAALAQLPKAQPAPDPLRLTDNERKELGEALEFTGQAKRQYDAALADTINTPLERLNALETVGRLQRAFATLQAAQQHLIDLREKHKASRPGCDKCEYSPDGQQLTRPRE